MISIIKHSVGGPRPPLFQKWQHAPCAQDNEEAQKTKASSSSLLSQKYREGVEILEKYNDFEKYFEIYM